MIPRYQRAALGAAAGATLLMTAACGQDEDSAAAPNSPSSSASAPESGSTPDGGATGGYRAGDYDEEGSYSNPGGQSTVEVEVDLESDGTISAVEVTPEASGTSLQYQRKFAGGISGEVVGKNIDSLDVSKVAGSSLTSEGFNQAIEKIKADARA